MPDQLITAQSQVPNHNEPPDGAPHWVSAGRPGPGSIQGALWTRGTMEALRAVPTAWSCAQPVLSPHPSHMWPGGWWSHLTHIVLGHHVAPSPPWHPAQHSTVQRVLPNLQLFVLKAPPPRASVCVCVYVTTDKPFLLRKKLEVPVRPRIL